MVKVQSPKVSDEKKGKVKSASYEVIYEETNVKYELSRGKKDLRIKRRRGDGKIEIQQYERVSDEKKIKEIKRLGKKWKVLRGDRYNIFIQKKNDDNENTENYKIKKSDDSYWYYTKRRK